MGQKACSCAAYAGPQSHLQVPSGSMHKREWGNSWQAAAQISHPDHHLLPSPVTPSPSNLPRALATARKGIWSITVLRRTGPLWVSRGLFQTTRFTPDLLMTLRRGNRCIKHWTRNDNATGGAEEVMWVGPRR